MNKRPTRASARLRAALAGALLCAAAACDEPAKPLNPVQAAPPEAVSAWPRNDKYGFVVGAVATQAQANAMMDRALKSGVGWVKLTLYWYDLQPHGGPIDSTRIAGVRHVVRAARERGLRVVAMLEGFPGFTRNCGAPGGTYYGLFVPGDTARDRQACEQDWRFPPDDGLYITLQLYLTELMDKWFATYPYDIQVYSVGNEFNSPAWFGVLSSKFLPGYTGPDRDEVAEYCKVVNYVSGATRPRGKQLIAGELAHFGNPHNDPAGEPYQWLRRVLQTCGPSFDIVGVHSYHSGATLDTAMVQYQQMINTYAPGKPLWLTEVGSNLYEATTDSAQAVHIATIFHEQKGGRTGQWAKSFYWRLDGPIDRPGDYHYPFSYLVNQPNGYAIDHPQAYNCIWWYAVENAPAYGPTLRPLNCVPK